MFERLVQDMVVSFILIGRVYCLVVNNVAYVLSTILRSYIWKYSQSWLRWLLSMTPRNSGFLDFGIKAAIGMNGVLDSVIGRFGV